MIPLFIFWKTVRARKRFKYKKDTALIFWRKVLLLEYSTLWVMNYELKE